MDKGLYLSMHSAKQLQTMQQINANNLANANTVGFKADFIGFLENAIDTHHLPTRSYSEAQDLGTHFEQGHLINTQNPLDVAITGEGFFAIENRQGEEAYTRRGDFVVSPEGYLQTTSGLKVLGDSNEPIILPEFSAVSIAKDGVVSVVPRGSEANAMVEVDRIKLVAVDGERIGKGADGLIYAENARGQKISLAADAKVTIRSGVLEGSNVNATQSMITMIELSRAFEMQLKYFEQAEDNDRQSSQLMRAQ